jgi:hypothetical protein
VAGRRRWVKAVQGAQLHRCRRTGRWPGEAPGVASSSFSSCSPPPSPLLRAAVAEGRSGLLGFGAKRPRGFLYGGPRACGTAPYVEGGDARRPCHDHAASIRRRWRGVGLGLAARAAGARGKREHAGGCAALSRSWGRRARG